MSQRIIMVVDDDASIVDLIQLALEDEGYQVLTAVNGAALDLARSQHPDLILLDIMMPGMDGVEVSQRLRADAATADIPIVAMSAHNRLQATAEVMQADARLPKPFDLEHLYDVVAHWSAPL